MIPLGAIFVSGYYLISEKGDVYCFGDIAFHGTVESRFNESTSIVASFSRPHGLEAVSTKGEIFTLASSCDKYSVPNITNVIDALMIDENIILFTNEGRVVNREGQTLAQCHSESRFIACSLASNGKDIYSLDENGQVCATNNASHYGDIKTLGDKNVHAVDIACSPWGNGYWIIDDIGGVFCFGEVDYYGSVPGDGRTCVAAKIIPSPTGRGYWIIDSRGLVLPFGDASYCGHPTPGEVTGKIVDMVPVSSEDRRDAEWLFTQLVDSDIAQLQGREHEEFSEPLAP